MDLKWLLVRRIVVVAVACLAFGSAYSIFRTVVEAKRHNAQLAESVGLQLDLQLVRLKAALDMPKRFPDWDIITAHGLLPGQCVQLIDTKGAVVRSDCRGMDGIAFSTPDWFLSAYKYLLNSRNTAERPILYRGSRQGVVIADSSPVATAVQAWMTISSMLGLSAFLIFALSIMTFWVIDRALAPTKQIVAALNRLAQGELDTQLPTFQLSELNLISMVINSLSRDLTKATSDRAELARKLVDAQEQERLHIARELHDDIAQQLSAINAIAACLRRKVDRNDPSASKDIAELEEITSGLIVSLRKTLTYLRPSEIDDLGLAQSLRDLVERHNNLANGATRFTLDTNGNLADLSKEASAHIYRIIQEALTNAAKHANARNVEVRLNKYPDKRSDKIELAIDDDGCGTTSQGKAPLSGWGVIGMRERVIALSGHFAVGPRPEGGFGLRVEFHTQPGR